MRGYPERAIWSLMRLSSISRIGSHHFPRSVHKSSQPDREGQSATRLALDRDVAAHHLTEVRLMATPRPVPLYLRAVADEIWEDSWNSSFAYQAATAQSAQDVKRSKERTQSRRRQRELKSRAPSCVGARPQTAAMQFDDPPTDRESHAGAVRFGGEECFKNAFASVDRKPHAEITHRNH